MYAASVRVVAVEDAVDEAVDEAVEEAMEDESESSRASVAEAGEAEEGEG